MPDARARAIALCRRGFKPKAFSSLARPPRGEVPPPHPAAQRELEAFFERSTRRFEPVDAVLEALFADAVDVGVMRAAVVYENSAPEGLLRFDARLAPRTHRGFVGEPGHGPVVFAVDVWERAPVSAEERWRWLAVLAGPDVPDHVLAPIVRHLQNQCKSLLRTLLGRVLAGQGVRHAIAWCHLDDPLESGAAKPGPCCELASYSYEGLRKAYNEALPGVRRRKGQRELAAHLSVSRTTLIRHLDHLAIDWKRFKADGG